MAMLSPEDVRDLLLEVTTEEQMKEINTNGGADFALALEDGTRFRVSAFKERRNYGVVMRVIPTTLLTLEQLGLPEQVQELLYKPRGLILVTGPTGSGKSTTLLPFHRSRRDCHRPEYDAAGVHASALDSHIPNLLGRHRHLVGRTGFGPAKFNRHRHRGVPRTAQAGETAS